MARQQHTKILRAALSSLLLLGLVACSSSGPKVITNTAPGFSVENYETFGYLQPLSTDRGTVRSMESTQLMNSTTLQLTGLGLELVESDPDLLVNFIMSSKETIETRPSSGATINYGRGRYGRWGGYGVGYGTTQEVVQRTEGSLGIDIIDARRNELVWEGAASGRVTDSMRENRQEVLDGAVREIFTKFPKPVMVPGAVN